MITLRPDLFDCLATKDDFLSLDYPLTPDTLNKLNQFIVSIFFGRL